MLVPVRTLYVSRILETSSNAPRYAAVRREATGVRQAKATGKQATGNSDRKDEGKGIKDEALIYLGKDGEGMRCTWEPQRAQ